jgi:hypothetical protein
MVGIWVGLEDRYSIELVWSVLCFVSWAIKHRLCPNSSSHFVEDLTGTVYSSLITWSNAALNCMIWVIVVVNVRLLAKKWGEEFFFGLDDQVSVRNLVIMHYDCLPLRIFNRLRLWIKQWSRISNWRLYCPGGHLPLGGCCCPVMLMTCNYIIKGKNKLVKQYKT